MGFEIVVDCEVRLCDCGYVEKRRRQKRTFEAGNRWMRGEIEEEKEKRKWEEGGNIEVEMEVWKERRKGREGKGKERGERGRHGFINGLLSIAGILGLGRDDHNPNAALANQPSPTKQPNSLLPLSSPAGSKCCDMIL